MEASALQAPAGLARARISVASPLLRLRSDEQLLALFRAGHEDAFRIIHDRYRQRLFAYARQMLPGSTQDAEDALQDVFVRAYAGLRANHRQLALRPWLYRVAHNRCVDELRRPVPPAPAILQQICAPTPDPVTQVEQRESLRRLISDLRRLPAQQRSALLMRELGGMSYAEVATAMDVTVPAVKSLLVRARIGLTLAVEARDTACVEIREELTLAHDRGVRSSGTVRRHLADCGGCRQFKSELRNSGRQFAALTPTLGPIGVIANMLGIGGGGSAAGGGAGLAATGGATATTGAIVGGGTAASAGSLAAGATHVATLLAAAVVTAGGAVAIQRSITTAPHRSAVHATVAVAPPPAPAVTAPTYQSVPYHAPASVPAVSEPTTPAVANSTSTKTAGAGAGSTGSTSISGGDDIIPTAKPPSTTTDPTESGAAGETPPAGTTDSTSTTGTSNTGATTSTGTAGTTGTSSTSTGTTGTAGTGTGTGTGDSSSSTGTGSTTATTATSGTTTGTGTGSTTGSPTSP